ncbi:hypothetical protein [Arthrobacter sp. K5]|jgi:hypothetical protein|uniref:Uncharacterized protein n=1 Tax=Arthrobacter sp. K5 TaxID=2839623 RepID=A0AAU8ELM9_9MICC
MEMFGRAHVGIKGHGLDGPGKGSRVAWIVAGALAAAVTLAVVVWEVLDRTEDSDAERTGEEPAPRRKWWSVS